MTDTEHHGIPETVECRDEQRYVGHHTWQTDATPSESVITTLAAALGVEPDQIRPLYDVVDPDALDRLFAHRDAGQRNQHWSVSFSIENCVVTVYGDGQTVVSPIDG